MTTTTTSIRRRLRLAFAIVLLGIVVCGATGALGTMATSRTANEIATLTERTAANAEVLQTFTDAEIALRGWSAVGDSSLLTQYRRSLADLPFARSHLGSVVADDPDAYALATKQQAASQAWIDSYAQRRLTQPGGLAGYSPKLLAVGRRHSEKVRSANARLASYLTDRIDTANQQSARIRGITLGTLVGVTVLSLFVGALTSRRTSAAVRGPLGEIRGVLGRLADGQHDSRVEVAGPVETAEVASSVNALADEADRLRAQEEERRRVDTAGMELGRAVRESLDPEAVVALAGAGLGTALKLDRVHIHVLNATADAVVSDAWAAPGVPPFDDAPDLEAHLHGMRMLGRDGGVVAAADLAAGGGDPSPELAAWMAAAGARALIGAEIRAADESLGVALAIRLQPHKWSPSEVHLVQSVASDIARGLSHARLFAAQAEVVEQLRALDQTKNDFMSTVSHELRTPLTSITGYLELIEEADPDPLTPEQHKMLAVIRRNVQRLRTLIEDLLTLSRVESGAFRTTFEDVDLGPVVQGVCEDLVTQARDAKVTISVDLPAEPVQVSGDAGQLSRAILNLASNAVKFTPAGGSVVVGITTRGDEVDVTVADTGIGIPEADVGRLFTRFFRASNAVQGAMPGTGLGLVIVRAIAENHGGRVALDSAVGRGTTVTITLPRTGAS